MTSTGRNSPKNPYMDEVSLKKSANDQNSLREQNRSPLSREGGQFDDIISKISGYGSQKTQKMAKRDKVYSLQEAENLFWVFFQQKIKQSFQHMFLNILGNVLCCYKPMDELVALEKQNGDYKNLPRDEVFDIKKYQSMTKNEMSDSKFIETLIEKQSFSVLIEDIFLHHYEKEAPHKASAQEQNVMNHVQIFHKSIETLVKKNQDIRKGRDFVKFNTQSFKQLRAIQNKEIDNIYKIYK